MTPPPLSLFLVFFSHSLISLNPACVPSSPSVYFPLFIFYFLFLFFYTPFFAIWKNRTIRVSEVERIIIIYKCTKSILLVLVRGNKHWPIFFMLTLWLPLSFCPGVYDQSAAKTHILREKQFQSLHHKNSNKYKSEMFECAINLWSTFHVSPMADLISYWLIMNSPRSPQILSFAHIWVAIWRKK